MASMNYKPGDKITLSTKVNAKGKVADVHTGIVIKVYRYFVLYEVPHKCGGILTSRQAVTDGYVHAT